ncbi:unnamed protein product [Protopolystoma xenopodis]|uniref:Uncharacterized protein n=1 Tax=Protopolystoma xenopodis TaxID=117903 RepID=A0A3S5FGX3_9PLAT|nr:unnamed protein product [Protopolystoma xenopodis]
MHQDADITSGIERPHCAKLDAIAGIQIGILSEDSEKSPDLQATFQTPSSFDPFKTWGQPLGLPPPHKPPKIGKHIYFRDSPLILKLVLS